MSNMFGAMESEIPALGRAVGLLANPYTAAAAAVAGLGVVFYKCTDMANKWHEKMAEINVTAELSKDKLRGLSDKLLEIGSRNVAPLEEVPKAFNRIISAGLSVNDSLKTLEPTLRAAKAGFTDIETVASAAVSVMMSSGKDATRVYDILFETVKEGNAEFKDIAQYLPKVIPLARNVGFELEEAAGAFASLTGKLSAEQSTTALQGIMRALSDQRVALGQIDKKTGKYISGFKSIGIEVYDRQTKQIRPLLDIVNDLNKAMSGLSDKERMLKFDKLGLDQTGSIGFSTLMQDVGGLQKAIEATTNSQGALNKAYEDAKTPMDSWKIIQNQIQYGMIKLGEIFLPIIQAAGEKILKIIYYFKDLYNNSILFRDILSAIGTYFEIAFAIASAPIKYVINLLKNICDWIKAIIVNISGMIAKTLGIKTGFKGVYDAIRPYLIWIKEFLSEIGGLMYDIGTFNIDGVRERIKNFKLPDLDEIKKRESAKKESDEYGGDFNGVVEDPTANGNAPDVKGGGSSLDDARKISGGSQTKNVTINIDSFVKGFNPTSQTINSMDKTELEKWMTEMFLRVVRSAEMAM
jgi:TP901 family phage tail tape measure protein